jgi:hypothetical protein
MHMSAVDAFTWGARGRGCAGWAKDGSPADIVTRIYARPDRADLRCHEKGTAVLNAPAATTTTNTTNTTTTHPYP